MPKQFSDRFCVFRKSKCRGSSNIQHSKYFVFDAYGSYDHSARGWKCFRVIRIFVHAFNNIDLPTLESHRSRRGRTSPYAKALSLPVIDFALITQLPCLSVSPREVEFLCPFV